MSNYHDFTSSLTFVRDLSKRSSSRIILRYWAFVLQPHEQLQWNTCLYPYKGNCGVCPVLYLLAARPEQWVFLMAKPITDGKSSCLLHGLWTLIVLHLSLKHPDPRKKNS